MEQSKLIKVIVPVMAEFDAEESLKPLSFIWEDGRRYEIDKVLDVRRAASLKAGGSEIRYTYPVREKQTHLFREEDHWFMERK